ncbi:MAG: Mur ligase family protein [Verrucomicrobia bacterium]|nr:Mur ligase family protein [Verrucomicrobiota bacterium]
MTPVEALAYLHQLSQFGFQPGLDSTRRLAAAVGNPQERLRFIHVAGTNGKGSTCAFLESMYRAAGFRTGLYTSPHLVRFGERIQVGRCPLPDETLARLVSELRQRMPADLTPTFFEFTTVVALMAFAEAAVDLVLWETGLGGRLDATNIVTPLASVITAIGLDHMQVLGGTVGEIAAEKAGIIKPGIPIVTSVDRADALAVIQYRARELDAHCVVVDAAAVGRMTLPVALIGPHQRVNATLAVVTIRLLRAFLPVSDEHLAHGLANTHWAGRMQIFQRGEQTWLLDNLVTRWGAQCGRRGRFPSGTERTLPPAAPRHGFRHVARQGVARDGHSLGSSRLPVGRRPGFEPAHSPTRGTPPGASGGSLRKIRPDLRQRRGSTSGGRSRTLRRRDRLALFHRRGSRAARGDPFPRIQGILRPDDHGGRRHPPTPAQ